MASTEEKAYEIMRELDVSYVLVIFGGLTGYSSDGNMLDSVSATGHRFLENLVNQLLAYLFTFVFDSLLTQAGLELAVFLRINLHHVSIFSLFLKKKLGVCVCIQMKSNSQN